MALAVEIIRAGDRGYCADEINFTRLVALIEFQDNGMILIKISFRAAKPRMQRWHDSAVEPLVGVQHNR